PAGLDTADLWIKAEVVETFAELKHWPDGADAKSPDSKTTVEYWKVGPTHRAVTIDNHKDFWLESEAWCAGRIGVTITLQLGRGVQLKGADGAFAATPKTYVLERRSYDPAAGHGASAIRWTPLEGEPVNVWAYAIPWSTCPNKMVPSHWVGMRMPEISLVRS